MEYVKIVKYIKIAKYNVTIKQRKTGWVLQDY